VTRRSLFASLFGAFAAYRLRETRRELLPREINNWECRRTGDEVALSPLPSFFGDLEQEFYFLGGSSWPEVGQISSSLES
jgi:hypothetical protein